MRHHYTLFFTLLLTFLCTCVHAQTVIAVMDFDGTATEMAVSTDVAFFDNNSDGFFGIHDANSDNTDGVPMDTGDGNASDVALVANSPIAGDFLFVNDLDDEGENGAATANVTFGPVTVTGQTAMLFSFDYDINGFDNGDDIFYELVVDGVGQGQVMFIDGGSALTTSGTISVVIPDGTSAASLILTITQNGDDAAGFDNFAVSADNTGLPCGVSSFGPTATETCVANTNGIDDEYTLSFDYTGIDAGGTLALLVDGSPASGFTNSGDDPTTTAGGTIDISSPDLIEGTSYEVTFTNAGGTCNYSVSGSVATNTCVSVCDLSSDISMLRLLCTSLSAGVDGVFGTLDYTGSEPNVVASITAPAMLAFTSDDPATDPNGELQFFNLFEGATYTITFSGGDCTGADEVSITFTVPADLCQTSDLAINEVLPNPTGGVDVNQDGSTNSEDEFVELYNAGTSNLDISGYSVEEATGVFHTFAAGTVLAPTEGIIIISELPVGGLMTPYDCYVVEPSERPFIGLNNTGTDGVVVRNAAGSIIALMNYVNAPVGESLALSPDGNIAGGYLNHTTVSATGAMSSPCSENVDNLIGLPVELVSLLARPAQKTIKVSWSTANEVDNDRFEIERRANDGWERIGTVAAGPARANTYTFLDESPRHGDNYYRLRQIDQDGSTTLHGPVMASFAAKELLIFPNPATTEIRFAGAVDGNDQLSLLDANGRVLAELAMGRTFADVSDLSPGVYLIRVARASGVEVVRFVKR
ncbi:MAG: lamin tail domain-containing protein [Bacteroidota bacterium]